MTYNNDNNIQVLTPEVGSSGLWCLRMWGLKIIAP